MSTPMTRQKTPCEPFSFSPENQKKVDYYIAKYPLGRQASAVLPLLDLGQRQNDGWVSQSVIEEVARLLDMPSIRVHEVASFYTMFNLQPVGKFHVQLCGTTPCWLRGAADIRSACEKHLRLKTGAGEITPDGNFSLVEVECLGACVNAPMVQINDDYYEDLTPETMVEILDDLAAGLPCKPGSAAGRHSSEPIGFEPKKARKKKGEESNAE